MLPTAHFIIYFHQGEEALARRLAAIAEETWRTLRQPLGVTPPRRTYVVLLDQTELANGFATPLPYDTIAITAVWPRGSEFIGDTDDWLRLVFTHEFTHIVHLDRSQSWARGVRRIFGRIEIAFPNLFLPAWQIEGLATYEESRITGEGRLHAGDFTAIVHEAARRDTLEPLDRVNGGLTDWPNGDAVYAYGVGFHQYLADRFGGEKLAQLADATARRVPYTGSRAFRRVFGTSLGRLWRDYEASIRTPPADDGVDVGLRRLTHHDYIVRGPRFDPFVCHRCAASVVYAVRSPHGFPALSRVGLDGSAPRRMATRYLGSTSAVGRQEIFFDQQELRRNTGLYSDLYAWSRANGRVRRITREARLLDPDLAPGGDVLAAVRDRPGERDLVLVRLAPRTTIGIETLIAEPETQFSTPRWSPDGRSIAVERHRLGALPEIVLVEVATRSVRTIAAIAGARVVTPAWHPDGQAIVAAVAPRDTPFNLYEFPIDGGAAARQLTHTTGGATWPDVSPDGNTIVFVGYTPEGFDLFALPYPVSSPNRMAAGAGPPVDRAPQRAAAHSGDAVASADVTSSQTDTRLAAYSPLKTIRPTSWTPIIESDNTQVRIGAATGGVDVLAYHAYAASATWLVARPAGAPAPRAATPDWRAYYAYDRWRPTLWVSASAATSFFSGPATDAGTPASAALRERAIEAGLLLPIRHVRTSHAALFSMRAAADDYTLPDRTISRDTRAVRAAWSFLSARTYGYSVSREDGVAVGATAESVSRALGSFAGATAFTADLRAYLPGAAAHHVIALRAAGGVAAGDSDVQRTFHLGGAAGNPGVIDFGRDAASLLRGFGSDTFAGSHVAVVNADYRFPIARPQRGAGTWPVMLHTVHGALFADAGHAWTRTFRAQAIKTCVGAELSADVVAGYLARVTLTAGVARGHDGSGTIPDRTVMYARVGRAF